MDDDPISSYKEQWLIELSESEMMKQNWNREIGCLKDACTEVKTEDDQNIFHTCIRFKIIKIRIED